MGCGRHSNTLRAEESQAGAIGSSRWAKGRRNENVSGRQAGRKHLRIEFGRDEVDPKSPGLAVAGLRLYI